MAEEKKKALCGTCPMNMGYPYCVICVGIVVVIIVFIASRFL